jgi:hypothetical protein
MELSTEQGQSHVALAKSELFALEAATLKSQFSKEMREICKS